MHKLNLPDYGFKLQTIDNVDFIFDVVRKKYVKLTPEEWVRQNFIRYLHEEKSYPFSLMAVEKQIKINGKPRRFDLVVYSRKGFPWAVAEFKSPGVKIGQETFDQAVRYNMSLFVEIVLVSNGLEHYACKIDYENNSFHYLAAIPVYPVNQ